MHIVAIPYAAVSAAVSYLLSRTNGGVHTDVAKRAYHRLYELNTPKKRKSLKIESHLGQDIQEARKRGLEYGAYMAMKKWGALHW